MPQPTFFDVMRLTDGPTAPNGLSWGALYLCGVLPDDRLRDVFGNGFARAVINDFDCRIQSGDVGPSRVMTMFFGEQSIDEWARPFPGLTKTRTTIHGRDAVVYEQQPSDFVVEHQYVLAIPDADDAVLVVDIIFYATLGGDDDEIPPDSKAAQDFSDEVARTLIDLSA